MGSRYLYGTLSFDQIREKIVLQEEFLEKYELVDPGLTKWKGKLLFVICKLRMFLADQEMARERITKQEFTSQLRKCITGLDEVIRCLDFEPKNSRGQNCNRSKNVSEPSER